MNNRARMRRKALRMRKITIKVYYTPELLSSASRVIEKLYGGPRRAL